ncbi:MAG: YwaF family protein [Clostridia bacterium]|nr:YwaF family protein [Clostridia bacterium]
MTLTDLIKNFFTHKDFLPPASEIPGTMFTPLHFIISGIALALVIALGLYFSKRSERAVRITFAVLWASAVVLEIVKISWETLSGRTASFEWGGVLPLYPCSVFMYAMPFAIWGRGLVRRAASGYVCTLGVLGATVNFVYPATVMSNYSAISFAGFHTVFYHCTMLFVAFVMLRSGYHSFRGVRRWYELFLPALPLLFVSVIANAVNFSKIGSDYMFFRLSSFFFAPIGAALPTPVCVLIVYILYLIIHAVPYLPSYVANKRRSA